MEKQTVIPFKLTDLFKLTEMPYLLILLLLDMRTTGWRGIAILACIILGYALNWITKKYFLKHTIIREDDVKNDKTLRRIYVILLFTLGLAGILAFYSMTLQDKTPPEKKTRPSPGQFGVASTINRPRPSPLGSLNLKILESTEV